MIHCDQYPKVSSLEVYEIFVCSLEYQIGPPIIILNVVDQRVKEVTEGHLLIRQSRHYNDEKPFVHID